MKKIVGFIIITFTLGLFFQSNALAFGDKQGKKNLETPTSRPYENVLPKTDKKKSPTASEQVKDKTRKSVSDTLNKSR